MHWRDSNGLAGYDVFFPDRHRRARHQDAAYGPRRSGHDGGRARRPQHAAVFKEMVNTLNCSHDDFIRTREEEPSRAQASREIWKRMEANGDIYLDTYSGWYSVRDEAYYDAERADRRPRTATSCLASGHARRVGRGGELLSSGSPTTRTSCWPITRPIRTSSGPETAPQRGGQLRQGRAPGPFGVAHDVRLGHARCPANDRHIMYVWVDALTNYITGVGIP